MSFLKTNELEKYLVVARCTEMWLRMRGVPPISPSAKKQRNTFTGYQALNDANPSVESRTGVVLLRPKCRFFPVALFADQRISIRRGEERAPKNVKWVISTFCTLRASPWTRNQAVLAAF
jgi:hypothetical protein